MALRAFHANPNIGGFGNENTAPLLLGDPTKNLPATNASTKNPNPPPDAGTVNHSADESGDALCQIVKELVDNAVDACETARRKHQSGGDSKVYRVKVEILPYHTNDADDGKTPLQVTVSDNGSGMNEIQACVNAFQSSKGGDQDDANTAGRYGIGLTLCLLHAQRLVPGTYSCITSATREAQSFKRALFFVDTAGDTVECHREEEVAKGGIEESGTCVSLLVPVRTHHTRVLDRAALLWIASKLSRSAHYRYTKREDGQPELHGRG
jgi:HSP90 family molecular chaperone